MAGLALYWLSFLKKLLLLVGTIRNELLDRLNKKFYMRSLHYQVYKIDDSANSCSKDNLEYNAFDQVY